MSRRAGRVTRAYARVQQIISEYLNAGYNPTTREIQEAYYGADYDADSSSQYNTIYGCIRRGRNQCVERWDGYLDSNEFWSDLQKIRYQAPDIVEDAANSDDWITYVDSLRDEGPLSDELLDTLPALEALFTQIMFQFSDEGSNFIIPAGDPFHGQSRWSRATRAGWNIRERALYQRTVRVLNTQLLRGVKTQVKLPTGESVRRTLEFTKPIRALLEDGTSWACNNCTSPNVAEDDNCVVCGTPRTS